MKIWTQVSTQVSSSRSLLSLSLRSGLDLSRDHLTSCLGSGQSRSCSRPLGGDLDLLLLDSPEDLFVELGGLLLACSIVLASCGLGLLSQGLHRGVEVVEELFLLDPELNSSVSVSEDEAPKLSLVVLDPLLELDSTGKSLGLDDVVLSLFNDSGLDVSQSVEDHLSDQLLTNHQGSLDSGKDRPKLSRGQPLNAGQAQLVELAEGHGEVSVLDLVVDSDHSHSLEGHTLFFLSELEFLLDVLEDLISRLIGYLPGLLLELFPLADHLVDLIGGLLGDLRKSLHSALVVLLGHLCGMVVVRPACFVDLVEILHCWLWKFYTCDVIVSQFERLSSSMMQQSNCSTKIMYSSRYDVTVIHAKNYQQLPPPSQNHTHYIQQYIIIA